MATLLQQIQKQWQIVLLQRRLIVFRTYQYITCQRYGQPKKGIT
ncbi:hypothetical protein [Capnocytophaga sputigena]|nr:hypothetical protein [Capnocytophaga sputigena]